MDYDDAFEKAQRELLMSAITTSIPSSGNTILGQAKMYSSKSRTVFHGRVEVLKANNGYIVNITTKEGYECDTYVAATIQEVNERIAAAIVSFQLEQ